MDEHESVRQWRKEADLSQRLLSIFDMSILRSLPDMVIYMIRSMPEFDAGEVAFNIAVLLTDSMLPEISSSMGYPISAEVYILNRCNKLVASEGYAAVEKNRCTQCKWLIKEILKSSTRLDEARVATIVYPYVFGSLSPIQVYDASSVRIHIKECDEMTANKLIASFSKSPSPHSIILPNKLDPGVLKQSIQRLLEECPEALFSAFMKMGVMGSNFLMGKNLVVGYPFPSALPMAYATYISKRFKF